MSRLIIAPWEADDRPPPAPGFLFGGATQAAQVEAPDEAPCRDADDTDARRGTDAAPRFLERHAEDLRIARELGMNAFLFSMSWSRVMPGGRARPRREALDAYARIAEAATALGLRPTCALWAGDRPFGPRPAMLEPDAPERFGELAEQAGLRLGGLVSFITMQEPATLPAGSRLSPAELVTAFGAAASAHRIASEALRATCRAEVGLGIELVTALPLGRDPRDAPAARFVEAARSVAWLHLAAARQGRLLGALAENGALDPVRARLLGAVDAACDRPCDFVVARPLPPQRVAWRSGQPLDLEVDAALDRPLEPWIPLLPATEHLGGSGSQGPALLVTTRHASAAGSEQPDPRTGHVNDVGRVAAIEADVAAWRRALGAGVPLRGWFTDLLDGYDPEDGFASPTGLVHVDRASGARRIKASGEAFRRAVEAW